MICIMFELRRLRHLQAVVEHGHFGRAADAVHLTQPALTRSIQALEAEAGTPLLLRQRGAIEATEAGRVLLRHAATMLASARDLERDLQLARGQELGELRVGVGPFGGAALIGPAVGQLCREFPRLRVELVVAPWQELPERARARDVDLIVAELSEIRVLEDFQHHALSAHRTGFVCRAGHPLTRIAMPRAQDVFAYPLAAPRLPPRAIKALVDAMPAPQRDRALRDGPVSIECDSAPILKDILMSSDAVSNMPAFMFEAERHAGLLHALPVPDVGIEVQFGAAWLTRRPPAGAATRLRDLLAAHDSALATRAGPGAPRGKTTKGRG